jgi:hypothetical protein
MCKPGLGTHGVILHYNLEIEMASHRGEAKHALRDDRKKIAKKIGCARRAARCAGMRRPEQAKQLLNELACSSKSNRSEAPLILL